MHRCPGNETLSRVVLEKTPAMRRIIVLIFSLAIFAGCKKEGGAKVEIYLLKSYSVDTVQGNPSWVSIKNAVLDIAPFVRNEDIIYYDQLIHMFKLNRDILPIIKDYGPDKAFAVTVNGEPIYYGHFHPAYMSSITVGVATIDPIIFYHNELTISFVTILQSPALQLLDKRNDLRILNAFRATGRLR